MTSEGQGPTDYKLRLGEVLTRVRKEAGLQRTDAAAVLGCSEAKIGTIERGRSSVTSPAELRDLLNLYGVSGDQRSDIEALAAAARQRRPRTPWGAVIPTRLKQFFRIEEAARQIQHYHPELVHGLAQTRDYARSIISYNSKLRPAEIDRFVEARMARQGRLDGQSPVDLTLVIPEAVLHVMVGGPKVMRGQLHHLIGLVREGKAGVRIIPFSVGTHASRGFPFTVLTNSDGRKRVYLENLTDGIVVEDEDRIEQYEAAFTGLLDAALSSEDTLNLLAKVAAEL